MTSARYVLAPADESCVPCARARLQDADDFQLRSASSSRTAVADDAHPFLSVFVDAFAAAAADGDHGYLAIDRHDLSIHRGDIVHEPHCAHAPRSAAPQRPVGAGYRPRRVESYFGPGRRISDLSNPVTGMLSSTATDDVASLITAKVSGFTVRHGAHGEYIRAWGGHCDSYSRSLRVGLIEGIERICCATPDPAALVREVPTGIRTIEPADFGLAPALWRIPDPVITEWTIGTDLVTGAAAALPTRCVFYEAQIADPVYVQDSSNGCAAGGSDEEAQLFGLLEVIERDAFLLAWYADLPLRAIDPDTVADAQSRAYLQRLRLLGRTVRFLDATVGIGVPTVIAVCDTASGGLCFGAGSHPDPERALQSALVEVASDFQVIEDHLHRRRDELEAMLTDRSAVRAVEDHADLYGHPRARSLLTGWARGDVAECVPLHELRRDERAGTSVASDLSGVVDAVAAAGFSPIAVDVASSLSRRHRVSCAKVVVPGLLPLDFGWSQQRALDMPRLREQAAQWLHTRTGTAQPARIHPHPHPFP